MKRVISYILIGFGLVLASCGSMYKLENVNLAQTYNPQNKTTAIETNIWHLNDSVSALSVRFNQSDVSEEKVKSYNISYEIYDTKESTLVFNSEKEDKSILLNDTNLLKNNIINCPTIVINKLTNKSIYLLKLYINNSEKKNLTEIYLNIDKTNALNRQNFQLKDEDGSIIYRNYIKYNEAFKITYNNNTTKTLYVKYFKPNNSIALPPYSADVEKTLEFKADSVYKISLSNYETNFITLTNEGMYHIQADTLKDDGLTLYQYNYDYPFIKTPLQTLFPLRYLSTRKEFDELNQSIDYKYAVDKFWLNIAGNPDRAKSLIKKYYNAVKDANRFFTSYTEGWRTVRGMIYIIYGPPTSVFKSINSETWVYGIPGNLLSLKFIFDNNINPFTDNDYILRRDPALKASWFDAVEIWRR